MALGLAALSGVPPLAGFFSKESILTAAEHATTGEVPGVPLWGAWSVLVVGAVSVVVTAAYCTRLWLRTLSPAPPATRRPSDGRTSRGPWMQAPLWLLAVPTVLLGGGALLGSRRRGSWTGGGTERLTPALITTLVSLAELLARGPAHRRAGVAPVPGGRSCRRDRAAGLRADGGRVPAWTGSTTRPSYARPGSWPTSRSPPTGDLVDGHRRHRGRHHRARAAGLRRGQDGNPQRYLTVGLGGFAVAAAVFVAALAAIGGGA